MKKKFWRYQNDHGTVFRVRFKDNNLTIRELDIWNSTTTSSVGAKCVWMESINEHTRNNIKTNIFRNIKV